MKINNSGSMRPCSGNKYNKGRFLLMNSPAPLLIPTILCGGSGSRLWPVSRAQHPKPFIRLEDNQSFLQKAYLRGVSLPNVSEMMTVTNRDHYFKTRDDYSEIKHLIKDQIHNHFILEPFGRNTAPAIAAASLVAAGVHGNDVMLLVLAADHLITDQQCFADAVNKACELAQTGKLVTFGIQPTAAETGYGYIESSGFDVVRFIEKPDLEKAKEYFNSGYFLWNSGMFCFTAGTMLGEMEKYCPELLAATRNCLDHSEKISKEGFSQIKLNPEHFESVANDSIDYTVMEKTGNAAVVACDIGWSDIGNWNALGDLGAADDNNNRVKGDVLLQDSKNCTIHSEDRVVGAVGVDNLVIIDTPDALLVADKNRTQDVKHLYSQLKAQDHEAYKLHRTAHRPWGCYTVLEEGPNFKIKRIEVKPGASLSVQMHHHRSEHWIVIRGTAKVLNNEQELILRLNESTYIPAEHKHCLENIGSDVLVIIEVQTGDYLGEDDIVRFKDNYGRVS